MGTQVSESLRWICDRCVGTQNICIWRTMDKKTCPEMSELMRKLAQRETPECVGRGVDEERYPTLPEMYDYGYHWVGMKPLSPAEAERKYKIMAVYLLHQDGSESLCETKKDFDEHYNVGGLFGVEIPKTVLDKVLDYCQELLEKELPQEM